LSKGIAIKTAIRIETLQAQIDEYEDSTVKRNNPNEIYECYTELYHHARHFLSKEDEPMTPEPVCLDKAEEVLKPGNRAPNGTRSAFKAFPTLAYFLD
jgi:hypothetical protein